MVKRKNVTTENIPQPVIKIFVCTYFLENLDNIPPINNIPT